MNQADVFEAQLVQKRTEDARIKKPKKTKSKKTGLLKKLLKNPLAKPLTTSLVEVLTGGIGPGCTGYVAWTYVEEKKSGKTPNIAEYITVGILASTADSMGLLGLTGVLLFLSYAITLPCLGLLIFWGIHKHGIKGAMSSKNKS